MEVQCDVDINNTKTQPAQIHFHPVIHLVVVCLSLGTDHLTWRGVMVSLFRSEFFFRTTQELEYLFILLRKARIFFQEFIWQKLWIRLLFFFLHQNQNIFFSYNMEISFICEGNQSTMHLTTSNCFINSCSLSNWKQTDKSTCTCTGYM
jgi:hypothetical protein